MLERLIKLAADLRIAGNNVTGDYRNFFHDRASMLESWIRGYRSGDEGDPEYRLQVIEEFEQLIIR